MTTAAARLLSLAGTTGTAGALLALIGAGSSAATRLVAYSGLGSTTAAAHLLADSLPPEPPAPPVLVTNGDLSAWRPRRPRRRHRVEEDEALLLAVIH